MRRPLILIACTIISFGFNKHDFHVSITDLYLKQDTVQIAIKAFTHDLEETLKETTGSSVFLDNSTDPVVAFKTIKGYCEPRFEISSATKNYHVEWIGHEYEDDVTWIYAYSIRDPKASIITIKNTLLQMGNHPQHNMIHLTQNGEIETKICTKEQPEVRFILK